MNAEQQRDKLLAALEAIADGSALAAIAEVEGQS